MNERRILFETSLAKTGGRLVAGTLLAMMFFAGLGLYLAFGTSSFPYNSAWIFSVGVVVFVFWRQARKFLPLRRNPGVYQISIDNYGLYIHSDAPDFAPSFSVLATDLSCLVRRTFKDSDGDDNHYEYYVETKSGRRYQIKENLMFQPPLNAMDLFDQVTDYFPTLEIAEEVQNF